MPQPLNNFVALFDYSQWELAIQKFFCDTATAQGALFAQPPANGDPTSEAWSPGAGMVAFLTGYQCRTFQQVRPRVSLQPIPYKPIPTKVADANGQLKFKAWAADLEFWLITANDYDAHQTTLATLRATIAAMNPIGIGGLADISGTGLNPYLAADSAFELAQVFDLGNSLDTRIDNSASCLITKYKVHAVFAIRANAWPGGLLSA